MPTTSFYLRTTFVIWGLKIKTVPRLEKFGMKRLIHEVWILTRNSYRRWGKHHMNLRWKEAVKTFNSKDKVTIYQHYCPATILLSLIFLLSHLFPTIWLQHDIFFFPPFHLLAQTIMFQALRYRLQKVEDHQLLSKMYFLWHVLGRGLNQC